MTARNAHASITALRLELDEWRQAAAVEAGLRREAQTALANARAEQIRLLQAVFILTNERDEARAARRDA